MLLKIGITDTESRYANYPLWIKANDSNIEIIHLTTENKEDIKKCDGIVLSGGIDTHPKFYKNNRLNYPFAPKAFNKDRDRFEMNVFTFTQENKIPLLAICRGMQLVNVALGGDLIQDIEENGKKDHRRHADIDGLHEVSIIKNSLLFNIVELEKGVINSAHHQALGNISSELIVNAFSPDGIPEGAEWKNKNNKSFLLCVQWHPERLAQQQPDNPFTKKLRKGFLEAVKNNYNGTK